MRQNLCTYVVTMNESPLFISNTYIIPHNLITLTNKFIKKINVATVI